MIHKAVKKILLDKNLTVRDLAKIIRYSEQHVSNVISGSIDSQKVKKLIAEALGRSYDELWTEDDN